jgi:RHS repeat-associated protein
MQTSIFKPMGDTIQYSDNFLTDNILESQTISPWGETASTRHNIATNTINTRTCQADKKFVYSQENDPLTRKPTLESYTLTTPEGITDTFTFATNYDYKKGILTKKETKTTSAQGVSITEVDYKKGKFTAVSPEKRKSIIEFDPQTLLPTKIRQADLEPIELEYTKEGELKKYTYGDYKAKYTYDTKGNLIKREEPYANTTYEYDLLNRLTKETRSDGTSISYTYDPKGNIEKLVVPHAKEYTQSYTHADQRELFRSPLGYTTSYTYDKQERLTKLQRASLKTIEFNYEEGRLSSLESDGITTYYTYACNTQPSSITKEEETLLYSYDGELLTRLQHEGTLNQSIDYTYNNRFLPTSLSYADQTTRYTYDKDGLLLSSGDFTLVRDKKSALVESLSDNSFILKYKYQKDGTLKKLTAKNYTLELHTDKGKIIEKKEKLGKKNNAYRYTYDTRGRLTQVKKNAKVVESYTYDANSNRLSATINGVTTSASYTLDDNLEVYGDNTYRYDTDGNLIEKTTPQGTTTYLYTTKGTLTKVVTPTNTIEYILNPLEQRVAKKVDGQITEKYLWADLTTLLAVYDANDTLTQRYNYTHNRMPTSMTQNNQTYYLHYDQVGTLRLITDINQNIIKEITYDTFGNILQDTNPNFQVPFGFAGGLHDTDTNLVHFGYREYDPYTGKWTTKDPIDFNGGDSNLYGYVLQDPVNLVDPKGLNPLGLPWRQDSVGNGKSGKFPLGNGNTIYVDKNGNIVPSKSATSNTHNKPKKEKKMSDKELCDYFGDKNWHQKGYKQDYLKDFRKALNGDKNPDFYYDKLNNNLWLRGTRDKNLWINTGDKI